MRKLKVPALIALLLIAGIAVGVYTGQHRQGQAVTPEGLFWPDPKPIGPFTMNDQHGDAFGLQQLRGRWTFVFFGYTHCPDVCPATLSVMSSLEERIARDDVRMVFVTLDPARDTPARLGEYIGWFNEDFVGLRGTSTQTAGLASQIGIAYHYGPPDANGDYLVDHTSSIFLLDPGARLVSIFSAPHDVGTLAGRFGKIEEFISSQDQG